MTTKHTPGPWQAILKEKSILIRPSSMPRLHNIAILKPKKWAVLEQYALEENRANSRLIAAAPDLLSALMAAKDVLETAKRYFPKSIKDADRFSLLNTLANSVNPAILKAKGE